MRNGSKGLAGWLAVLALCMPGAAQAFCGFYVTGADTSLYANATMVVLMRDGTRTVLSMQNNYQGPPEAFALVIPVPTVLKQDQVKTLPRDIFQRVDRLGAPRLVEYWERDPCLVLPQSEATSSRGGVPTGAAADAGANVTVEARFAVGEYDVVILSANDSSALETWLVGNQYNIPSGAKDVLAPYVANGMKFFVAKVDPARVTFANGQAALSPLRFNYDSQEFSLPVKLGLLNSQGTQDLIVSILAKSRYEAANYANVLVPTNIRVQNDVRKDFASFYEALFAKVLEKNKQAVVTEYAWNAGSCDPCPTEPLSQTDLATLGADVTQNLGAQRGYVDYTLTRLHYRYTKDSLGDDLIFKEAEPIVGGRGIPDEQGELDDGVQRGAAAGVNNFQGRYVILHPWEKSLACARPTRGQWGGPENGPTPTSMGVSNTALTGAPPRAGNLPGLLAQSITALDVAATNPLDPLTGRGAATSDAGVSSAPSSSGCSCQLARAPRPSALAALGSAALFAVFSARRRRRGHAE
jgi:hypothetical protein